MLPEHEPRGMEQTTALETNKMKPIKYGRGNKEFYTRMAQTKIEHNQDTESDDEQGNQNHDILYNSNTGNSCSDKTENLSFYIELRNIGNVAMLDTNHLHKQILGTTQPTTATIFFASRHSRVCTGHPLLHMQHTKCCLFDQQGWAASSNVSSISSCLSLPLQCIKIAKLFMFLTVCCLLIKINEVNSM